MTSVARPGSNTEPDEPPDAQDGQQAVLLSRADASTGAPAKAVPRTLLPAPVAQAVSFATRSTSLALRVGTFVGSFGLGAAKVTTLSSLELGRGILEAILSRAGRDVVARSGSELGRADAETLLEKSLENLHHAMTHVVFWTATGFHLTSTSLGMISDVSQLLLSSLDQFFGSTDSSRAIASIITLIRREFRNPATGVPGERVGVVDLVMGLCGLAYLQQRCRRLIEEEGRRLQIDEVVWDVVVLNTGARVDVHDDRRVYDTSSLVTPEGDRSIAGTIQKSTTVEDDDDIQLAEQRLKQQIMETLPAGASVSLSTSVSTTKTITADISGLQIPYIDPPPGFELLEVEALPPSVPDFAQFEGGDSITPPSSIAADVGDAMPTCRVVYRLKHTRSTTTHLRRERDHALSTALIGQGPDLNAATVNQDLASDLLEPPSTSESLEPPSASDSPEPPSVSHSPKPQSAAGPIQPPPVSDPHEPPSVLNPLGLPVSNPLGPPVWDPPERPSVSNPSDPPSASDPHKSPPVPLSLPPSVPRRDSSITQQTSKPASSTTANQKRTRKPASTASASGPPPKQRRTASVSQPTAPIPPRPAPAEKKGLLRNPLRKGPLPAIKNVLRRDADPPPRAPDVVQRLYPPPQRPPPPRASRTVPPSPIDTRKGQMYPRPSSRASYVAVHQTRRDSLVSQTDTYSIHSADPTRPLSPTYTRTESRAGGSVVRCKSEKDLGDGQSLSPPKRQPRARSHAHTASIHTLRTKASQSSLVPFSYPARSAYDEAEALDTLRHSGMVAGIFPRYHLLRNLDRYMRFASASYGSSFLKLMRIGSEMPLARALDDTHHELRSFAHHTGCDADSILLSSFVDPQGGSDSTGATNTGVPMVHYISLDHQSKAVVLACRGTLGFEDVLADMTCDYDDLVWRGSTYKVHKGIHASARRLLYGDDGRVLLTLRQALEEFDDYGVVLTGHSLGGAVTALLGVMLSEPATTGASFVTASSLESHRLLPSSSPDSSPPPPPLISLPPGRPIHVYAYGPPATMSSALRRATRGLVTSVANGRDLVPCLSLGVLHDLQAVALAFKSDNSAAKSDARRRVWEALRTGVADRWYGEQQPGGGGGGEDYGGEQEWAWAALKVLRASMLSRKLVPPGEVFVVESSAVLRRDAFVGKPAADAPQLGEPARRVVLKYVSDVEARFGEVRFGTGMLTDHSPGRYEDALRRLRWGVGGGL